MKTCIFQNYRVKELGGRVKSGKEASVCVLETFTGVPLGGNDQFYIHNVILSTLSTCRREGTAELIPSLILR